MWVLLYLLVVVVVVLLAGWLVHWFLQWLGHLLSQSTKVALEHHSFLLVVVLRLSVLLVETRSLAVVLPLMP
jgi:hypothetical protein